MEKAWFFERLLFKVVLVMITDKKYIKATMPINFFYALHKGNVTSKSNVTSSFRGIFLFTYCQLVKDQL